MTLQQALGDPTAQLSPFACRVLTSYIFYACLEHSFTGYPDDDAQGTEFWKNQHNLDNRLAVLFMVLPDSVRCPENIDKHDAVFINLALHTASICIHRVGAARGKGAPQHAAQAEGAAVRLLTAANEIFAIVKGVTDPQRLFSNPFVAFASFMAALVFFDDFAHFHARQSEQRLGELMDLMVVIANENLVTASLALQLAGHLKKTGIDPHALEKVSSSSPYRRLTGNDFNRRYVGKTPCRQGGSRHLHDGHAQRPHRHSTLLSISTEGDLKSRPNQLQLLNNFHPLNYSCEYPLVSSSRVWAAM